MRSHTDSGVLYREMAVRCKVVVWYCLAAGNVDSNPVESMDVFIILCVCVCVC